MKVEKKRGSFFILGYLVELIIKIWWSATFLLEIWRIWVMFLVKNPLYRSKSYFSGRNLTVFRPKKTHWSTSLISLARIFKIKIWRLLKQIWHVVISSFGLLCIGYKSNTEGTGYGIKWELLGTSWGTHWKLEEHIENLQIWWRHSENFMRTKLGTVKIQHPKSPSKGKNLGRPGAWCLTHIIDSKRYFCQPAFFVVVGVH
jgi:hypothetical protein